MRVVPGFVFIVSTGLGFWACSSPGESPPADNLEGEGALGGVGSTAMAAASNVSGTPTASNASNGSGTTAGPSATGNVSNVTGDTTSGNTSTSGVANGSGGNNSTGSANNSSGGSGGGSTNDCTDDRHPDHQGTPCSEVATWNECDAEWLMGYCDLSCGRCSGGDVTSAGGSTSTVSGQTNTTSANDSTNSNTSSTTGPLGDDNPWGNVENGQSGWASRYWDCCKPSCGWSGNASNPVKSCDINDNSQGANDQTNGCELNGESGTFTCHSMSPWAYSTQVAMGYAAVNGVSCGSCYQLQFSGNSHNAPGDPGSAALSGKSMIVMATNIGGIEQGQFDLLVPGGGVGDFNGCSGQWGIDSGELGARFGGFLPECKSGDHNATKSCMRDKCSSVFQSRGLSELYDGCLWFVDWFEAADNPSFTYRQIDCPSELVSAAH